MVTHFSLLRYFRAALAVCLFLLSLPLRAADAWSPETLPVPYLQDYRQHVSNPDGVLTAAAADSVNRTLTRLEKDKGVQSVVVVVKRLEGDDPYAFGMELARRHGIGSKKNTGLVVILATEDRSYSILTGNGLEGTLPDAVCRRVQNRVMLPALREGKWDEAIVATVAALDGIVRADGTVEAGEDEDDGSALVGLLAVVGCLGGVALVGWYAARRARRCPKCRKAQMKVVATKVTRPSRAKRVTERRLRCPVCGFEKTETSVEDLYNNGGAVPPVLGGGSRGFSGGSVGGTFGGGTFGGGGSSGRF